MVEPQATAAPLFSDYWRPLPSPSSTSLSADATQTLELSDAVQEAVVILANGIADQLIGTSSAQNVSSQDILNEARTWALRLTVLSWLKIAPWSQQSDSAVSPEVLLHWLESWTASDEADPKTPQALGIPALDWLRRGTIFQQPLDQLDAETWWSAWMLIAGALPSSDDSADWLAHLHETALSWQIVADEEAEGQASSLQASTGGGRKRAGAYYTPITLVDALLEHTLEPAWKDFSEGKSNPDANAAGPTVCDPACGAGLILLSSLRFLAQKVGEREPDVSVAEAAQQIAGTCLFGVDISGSAIALAKIVLWHEAGRVDDVAHALDRHLHVGDAIGGPDPEQAVTGRTWPGTDDPSSAQTIAPIDWRASFESIWSGGPFALGSRAGGFDAVVGNPPFLNAIENQSPTRQKRLLRQLYPELGGTADLAFYFLDRARRLVREGGWVGLIQPRTVLNARSCQRLRDSLAVGGGRNVPLHRVLVPRQANHFQNASVFVTMVFLGPRTPCVMAEEIDAGQWQSAVVENVGRDTNWWSALKAGIADDEAIRSGDSADEIHVPAGPAVAWEISASMTASDAYDLIVHMTDQRTGAGPKLITTGLIDPNRCHWGKARCRYLKRDYEHPRVSLDESAGTPLTASLKRRLAKSRRPKILVAGLSRRVECFCDTKGACVGAVSTFSIFHPQDDVDALKRLCAYLLQDDISERFRVELGANALGGGNTTMTKWFLTTLVQNASTTLAT